jgi:hypothetical protein
MSLGDVEACKRVHTWFHLIEKFRCLFFLPFKLRPLNIVSGTLNNNSDHEPIRGTRLIQTGTFLGLPESRRERPDAGPRSIRIMIHRRKSNCTLLSLIFQSK